VANGEVGLITQTLSTEPQTSTDLHVFPMCGKGRVEPPHGSQSIDSIARAGSDQQRGIHQLSVAQTLRPETTAPVVGAGAWARVDITPSDPHRPGLGQESRDPKQIVRGWQNIRIEVSHRAHPQCLGTSPQRVSAGTQAQVLLVNEDFDALFPEELGGTVLAAVVDHQNHPGLGVEGT